MTEAPAKEIPVAPYRSVSQLTSWLSCGEAFRLNRIAKAPRKPAAWLLQGIAFHAAIELWERSGRTASVEDCIAEFDSVWVLEAEQLPDVPLDQWLTGGRTKGSVDYERRVERGRQQVRDYIEWALSQSEVWRVHRDDRYPEGIGIEVPIRMEIGPTPQEPAVTLVGYIDQVVEYRDGSVRTRDLKTGTKLPEWPVQLGVYAMALRHQYGLEHVWRGDFYMCKNKDVTAPYDLTTYTLPLITQWFYELNLAIEQELFIPNPGGACNVCDVWQWCKVKGPQAGAY